MVSAALIFPGQGAQKVGMGRDLAERFPAARDTFAEVDDALGFSLSALMWDGPEEELTLTHVAGHAGTEGNELADRMAMLGAQKKTKELRLYRGDMDIPTLLKLRAG